MRLPTDQEFPAATKAIPPQRDRLQSKTLAAAVSVALVFAVIASLSNAYRHGQGLKISALPVLISFVFGAIVWALRAATAGGIAAGTLVCLVLLLPSSRGGLTPSIPFTALGSLVALFVLSFAATRFGRSRKEQHGLAESRRGRQASQIVANLGAAALFAAAGSHVGCIAALAEAAADTVSSEIGQALGGRVLLITTLKTVPSGTDGGITPKGTITGILAATIVVFIGFAGRFESHAAWIALAAGCAGLIFDSLLGATVERKGWIGNDLVNFSSTVFAGALAVLFS